jgi:hypothetical protein
MIEVVLRLGKGKGSKSGLVVRCELRGSWYCEQEKEQFYSNLTLRQSMHPSRSQLPINQVSSNSQKHMSRAICRTAQWRHCHHGQAQDRFDLQARFLKLGG